MELPAGALKHVGGMHYLVTVPKHGEADLVPLAGDVIVGVASDALVLF